MADSCCVNGKCTKSDGACVALGLWSWTYNGGTFDVNFAPDGEFVCVSYPAHAHWKREGRKVSVSWGQYGEYDMVLAEDGKSMEGSYRGYAEDWRKAAFTRVHTEEELKKLKEAAAHAHSHQHSSGCCHDHK